MIGSLPGQGAAVVKKSIVTWTHKQRHLSIEMKTKIVQHAPTINISIWHMTCAPIPTDSHVVATTTLVSIRRANCVCSSSCRPREGSRGAKQCWVDPETECACAKHFIALLLPSQNLKSVLVSIRHGFALLDPSRGQQEEQHTQFACRMETKVVVATTWLPIGIGSVCNSLYNSLTCLWCVLLVAYYSITTWLQ